MKKKSIIRCRWCEWWKHAWVKRPGKKVRPPKLQWEDLRRHVEEEHPCEFDLIQEWLIAECDPEGEI